jgi:hypothetical protein
MDKVLTFRPIANLNKKTTRNTIVRLLEKLAENP